eukprot:2728450-Prymnesium_polylepis.1
MRAHVSCERRAARGRRVGGACRVAQQACGAAARWTTLRQCSGGGDGTGVLQQRRRAMRCRATARAAAAAAAAWRAPAPTRRGPPRRAPTAACVA